MRSARVRSNSVTRSISSRFRPPKARSTALDFELPNVAAGPDPLSLGGFADGDEPTSGVGGGGARRSVGRGNRRRRVREAVRRGDRPIRPVTRGDLDALAGG